MVKSSLLTSSSIKSLAFVSVRMASTLYKDKAYVNGEWVSASSGATFEGIFFFPKDKVYIGIIIVTVSTLTL